MYPLRIVKVRASLGRSSSFPLPGWVSSISTAAASLQSHKGNAALRCHTPSATATPTCPPTPTNPVSASGRRGTKRSPFASAA
eukprot:784826-Prorocentrum_minimum.AAC.1